jgi:cysteine synthase A
VDAVGSVTFGAPPARRLIPGLGTAVRPQQLDESFIDEVMFVEEPDTIRACHRLAARGYLFGGSTGTVVSGAVRWLDENGWPDITSVAIAPDLGERYLETVYDTTWLEENYGEDVLTPQTVPTSPDWVPAIKVPSREAPAPTL